MQSFVWQGQRDSNSRHAVLETAALPAELYPFVCRHRSIFPGRRQPSIFDTDELNFCVRYGNRCDLIAISTSYTVS